jgi:hypothetical protein
MKTEFQKILQNAKKLQRSEPNRKESLYINPKPPVDEFKTKLLELPSDFAKPKIAVISKQHPKIPSKHSNKTVYSDKVTVPVEKKKVLGFKELMKLAKEPKEAPTKSSLNSGDRVDKVRSKSIENQRPEKVKKDSEIERQRIVNREKINQENDRRKREKTKERTEFQQNKRPPMISSSSISHQRAPHHSSFSNNLLQKKSQKNIPKDLIKLNVKKRDLSTIEEIQNDILKRKGVVPKAPTNRPNTSQNATRVSPMSGTKLLHREPPKTSSSQQQKRQRDNSDTKDYPLPKKNSYSSEISKIFGYNRGRYADDESSDDMEVGFNDLEREEKKRYFELMQFENWKTRR